jgi:hypothetical protein
MITVIVIVEIFYSKRKKINKSGLILSLWSKGFLLYPAAVYRTGFAFLEPFVQTIFMKKVVTRGLCCIFSDRLVADGTLKLYTLIQ